jgi:hypothetical protein
MKNPAPFNGWGKKILDKKQEFYDWNRINNIELSEYFIRVTAVVFQGKIIV